MHSFQQLMNNGSSLAPIQAGLTTGIFSCTAFAVSFPAITAFLLERFGRRRGIGIGGSLCLVAIVLQASSRSLHVFWLGRAVAGGAIGLVEQGDTIRIDIPNRSINVLLDEAELNKRRKTMDAKGEAGWKPVKDRPRKVSAALKAYAKMATSADKGAVRDISQL